MISLLLLQERLAALKQRAHGAEGGGEDRKEAVADVCQWKQQVSNRY